MPELINTRYPVYLNDYEDELYQEMKKDLVLTYTDNKEITAANVAALSGKLCQMSNGALYTDEKEVVKIHDRKLDALEDIIESANGKQILVACWFQHDLERIQNRLTELKIPFERLNNEASIRKWNDGKVLLDLSTKLQLGMDLICKKVVIPSFGLDLPGQLNFISKP